MPKGSGRPSKVVTHRSGVPLCARAGSLGHTGWSVAILLLCCFALSASGGAQTTRPPGYEDRRIVEAIILGEGESIELDGFLDEASWARAIPAGDFVQEDPANGSPATEATEVRVVYGGTSLYLGILCLDSDPTALLGNQMQRDQPLEADDRFMWAMDPFLDERSGYFFEINPSGAMGDGLISVSAGGGFRANKAWDGIWTARVRRTDIGWQAEIEIPFATLNFDPNASAWGVNFQRTVRRKNEESRWNGYSRNQGLMQMSTAGLLVGLEDVDQGLGLDLKPYLAGGITDRPMLGASRAYRGDAGFDLSYSVTPELRAKFTLNTDFAEIEVDDRRVNLTRFPLRFPEKRDFFLDGSNFFDLSTAGVTPFFSRRIGLDTDGNPQRIVYGVKLTGKVGAQDIGVLQVRTADSGNISGEDFSVVRLKRPFWTESHVAMIYTRRAGLATGAAVRQTAGAEVRLATSRLRGDRNLSLTGFYFWNSTPERIGHGAARGFRLHYPNDTWQLNLSVRELQDNFNPAVGFTPRRGFRRANPEAFFAPRPVDHPWIRRFRFGSDAQFLMDTKNRLVTRIFDVTVFEMELHSQDTFLFKAVPSFERLERDFEISPGVVLFEDAKYNFTRYRVEIDSADRRKVSASTVLEWGHFFSGTRREFSLDVGIRPRPGLFASVGGEFNRVELPEGNFSTSLVRSEINTQFGPWVSLANRLQYDTVSRNIGWQARFRWILKPGNDIFVVLNQNWVDNPLLPDRIQTLNRQLSSKLVFTRRF